MSFFVFVATRVVVVAFFEDASSVAVVSYSIPLDCVATMASFSFLLLLVLHSRLVVQPGPNDGGITGDGIRNPSTPVSIGIVVERRRRPAIAVRILKRNDEDDDVNRTSCSIGNTTISLLLIMMVSD